MSNQVGVSNARRIALTVLFFLVISPEQISKPFFYALLNFIMV